jgi:hypothetical protein
MHFIGHVILPRMRRMTRGAASSIGASTKALCASSSPFYPLFASLDVGAQMMKGRRALQG